MDKNKYPEGWNEKRVKDVIDHYENQTEDEAVAEDEAAYSDGHVMVSVPKELMPKIRELLAQHSQT